MGDVLIRTLKVRGEGGLSESDNSAKAKNLAIFKLKPRGTPGLECLVNFFDLKINFHFDKQLWSAS